MAQATVTPKHSKLLMLAAIAVVIAALYFAKEVLIPIALAIMLSFLLAPLVTRLQRLKLGRIPAVISLVILLVSGIGFLGYLVYGQISDLAEKLPQYQSNMEEKATWLRKLTSGGAFDKASRAIEKSIERATSKPSSSPTITPSVATTTAEERDSLTSSDARPPIPVVLTHGAPNPFSTFYKSLAPVIEPAATLGLVAILMIFMLVAREDLRDRIIRLIGQGRINITTQAMDEAGKRISKYLIAQCIVNGTYGLAVGLGLWLIGLTLGDSSPSFPNWLLWGLLTGVLRFIPYIGPWIGAAFPMIISLAVYHGMTVPLVVLAMFLVIELISNNWMEPWLYGSSTGVSEVAILIAAVFWTWLWGMPGLLLATPLTTIIVVMGKYVPQLEFLNILLGSDPALEPKYRFYQRLLAEDVEEAEDLLTEYVSEQSLVNVYDDVVLPALSLAETDRHRDRLDAPKQEQIRIEIRDLVEQMGDIPPEHEAIKTRGENGKLTLTIKKGTVPGPDLPVRGPEDLAVENQAANYDRTILCLPARDPADEISGLMLTQLLDRRGYHAENVSVEKLASEYVELVETKGVQVVFISALPPAAVTHARYIVKRLRSRLPDVKIIVGLWTVSGEANIRRATERLTKTGADVVVCTLREALHQLRQVVAPLALNDESEKKEAVPA